MTARARDIEGLRTPARPYWIARRTEVTVLLPGAVIHRSGVLARTVQIIPRERIQELTLQDGPLARRLGVLDLSVEIAGDTSLDLSGLAARTLVLCTVPWRSMPGRCGATAIVTSGHSPLWVGCRRRPAQSPAPTQSAAPDPVEAPGGSMSAPRLGIGIIGSGRRRGRARRSPARSRATRSPGSTRSRYASRERAEELLPGAPLLDVPAIVERSEMLLLAVPDDQLGPLVAGIAATGLSPGGQHGRAHLPAATGPTCWRPWPRLDARPSPLSRHDLHRHRRQIWPGSSGCPMAITSGSDLPPGRRGIVVELGGEVEVLAKRGPAAVPSAPLAHAANHVVVRVPGAAP